MDPYIGEIRMFAGTFAPRGWALCNGQTLNVNTFPELFSLITTTYGGDGYQTFQVPDLRGRAPIQAGQGPNLSNYNLGAQKGNENVILSVQNLPAHSHSVGCVANTQPDSPSPASTFIAVTIADPVSGVGPNAYSSATASDSVMNSAMIQPTGNNQAVSLLQPVLAINFIIALQGTYPSRP